MTSSIPDKITISIARIGSHYFPNSDTPEERKRKLNAHLGVLKRHRHHIYYVQDVTVDEKGVVKATAYLQEGKEPEEAMTRLEDLQQCKKDLQCDQERVRDTLEKLEAAAFVTVEMPDDVCPVDIQEVRIALRAIMKQIDVYQREITKLKREEQEG